MRRLRSNIVKRILGIALIVGCSGIFLNGYVGMNDVYAQEDQTIVTADASQTNITPPVGTLITDTTSIWEILNMVLKMIYLLLWPLLVVAGLALDNTLVYASIFHLDAPLWKFWNMMKNFANFALGFMVLFAIIKSVLTNSGEGSIKDEKSPLGIIKTTLIAGVLIQASWFLVAALVDISTIATYAVGGLPLSVLKNTAIGDQKILSVNSELDLNKFEITSAGGKEFQVWYSTKHPGIGGDKIVTISPCRIENSYVIGREYGDPKYKNSAKFIGTTYEGLELCVLYGNQLVMWPEENIMQIIKDTLAETAMGPMPDYNNEAGYNYYIAALLNMTGWDTQDFVTGNLVYLASGTSAFTTGNAFFKGTDSLTISSLIQKSKGFVGPLVTIYSSLLNFAQLSNTNITTTSGTSGIFIIKALVAIALFFPLIALALVLILRIGVLWLYIVASPFIILKASFKSFLPIKGLDDYLSIKGVMGIIFAPVVTVAALSISLIFMTALSNGFTSTDSSSAINETLGIEKIEAKEAGNDAISFGGIAQLEFSKLPWGEAMDRFSRLMVNFFAIGLMRMIVFAAIKANKIGETVGQKVQDFGETTFRTLPILPTGGGNRVGIGSLGTVLGGTPDRWANKLDRKAEKTADRLIKQMEGDIDTDTRSFTTENAKTIITGLSALPINATKAEAEKIFIDKNISTPDAHITTHDQTYYNTIQTLTDNKQKEGAIKGIELIAGDTWYETMQTKEANNKLNEIVSKVATDETTLNKMFLTPTSENKPIIEDYFTKEGISGKTGIFETTLSGTTYTITQDKTDPKNTKYPVKKK